MNLFHIRFAFTFFFFFTYVPQRKTQFAKKQFGPRFFFFFKSLFVFCTWFIKFTNRMLRLPSKKRLIGDVPLCVTFTSYFLGFDFKFTFSKKFRCHIQDFMVFYCHVQILWSTCFQNSNAFDLPFIFMVSRKFQFSYSFFVDDLETCF